LTEFLLIADEVEEKSSAKWNRWRKQGC